MVTRKKSRFSLFSFVFTSVLPLLFWLVFIFVLSSREKVAFTDNYPVSFAIFKSLHLVEYAILWLLWVRFFNFLGFKYKYLIALFFTFAYGLSDELHQSFIVGREGKLLDATVDALGGVIAWIIIGGNRLIKKLILKV